jgi:hypothetical protein
MGDGYMRTLVLALALAIPGDFAVAQTSQHQAPSRPPVDDTTTLGEDVTAEAAQAALERFAGSAPQSTLQMSSKQAEVDALREQGTAIRAQKRQMLLNMAKLLTEKGGASSQVLAAQILFEIQKDDEAELAAAQKRAEEDADQQRMAAYIDAAPASEEDKARARALLRFNPKASDIADALGSTVSGMKLWQARADEASKLIGELQADAISIGMMEAAADRAIELIENGAMTTGVGGWLASFIPGSAANRLRVHLNVIDGLAGHVHGSLDPVNNAPKQLKKNIRMILETRRISRELTGLAWLMAEGDQAAATRHAELIDKLANIGKLISGD